MKNVQYNFCLCKASLTHKSTSLFLLPWQTGNATDHTELKITKPVGVMKMNNKRYYTLFLPTLPLDVSPNFVAMIVKVSIDLQANPVCTIN